MSVFAIEDRGVDRDFHLVERCVVFGIEEALVLRGDHGSFAAPLDADFAEIKRAIRIEFFQRVGGFRPRKEHGVAQMTPGGFIGEDVGEENALVDLDAVFLALQEWRFGGDLSLCRRQSRYGIGRGEHQIFQADELCPVACQFVVEQLAVGGEEMFALLARAGENGRRGASLRRVAHRLLWQARKQVA